MELTNIFIQVLIFALAVILGYLVPFSRYRILIISLAFAGLILGYLYPFMANELLFHFVLVLALIFMIFYLAAHFRVKEFDTLSGHALRFAIKTITLCAILIGPLAWFLFEGNLFYAVVLVLILIGTDPQTINTSKKKIMYLERFESAFKSLLSAILVFLLIAMGSSSTHLDLDAAKALDMIIGLGTGIVLSLIYFKSTEKMKGVMYYFLTILFSAIVFFIARALDGNGILALAVVGFLFANMHIKGRKDLRIIAKRFSRYTLAPVFLLIAFYAAIRFPQNLFDVELLLIALLLFIVYLIIRFIAVHFSTNGLPLNLKEKIYMVVNNPHGSTPALAVLYLIVYQPESTMLAAVIIQLLVLSLLISIFVEYVIKGEAWKK